MTITTPSAALPELATRRQVAEYLGLSSQTLARWAVEKNGPRFVRLGGNVRYRRADVLNWIDSAAIA